MTLPDEPSQARVLRGRFARVPWREAIGGAIRDLAGNGRTALPERLEGAVYGLLVAELRGSAGAAASDMASRRPDGSRLLDLLDALLCAERSANDEVPETSPTSGTSGPDPMGRTEAPASGALGEAQANALVLRDRDASDIVDAATRNAAAGHDSLEVRVACALYALGIRRFVAGERGRRRVMRRAIRELRVVSPDHGLPGSPGAVPPGAELAAMDVVVTRPRRPVRDPQVEGFWAGWDAFVGAADYTGAVTRATAAGSCDSVAAAIAGGLAGAYWGSRGIPAAWRRALPDASRVRSLVDRLVETDAPGWDGKPWRTSTSSPLRVDRVDLSGIDAGPAAAVGITFLPGRRYVGYHTGAHWRDLETDAARLNELGVDLLLLLVEDRELVRCRVTGIGEALAAHGVELVRFPIRDPLLPRDGADFRATIGALLDRVRDGGSVAIACRAGLDRAGMTAACLLREAGLGTEEAIGRVQFARRGALALPDQQAYVRDWPPLR